jgi:hypothetical protein
MPENNDLHKVMSIVRDHPDCRVLPAAGMPSIGSNDAFPDDLAAFYSHCGGLLLFQHADFPWRVSAPEQLVPAGPIPLGGHQQAAQIAAAHPDDLTTSCYIIADDGTGHSTAPHVVIDLHPARTGRCYATGWDTFGLVGEMPIIALNMADLITWLLEAAGDKPFGGDRPLGDAYKPSG